jgi:hypothetical protein
VRPRNRRPFCRARALKSSRESVPPRERESGRRRGQARPTGALIRACAGSSHGTSLLALLGTRGAVPKVPRNYRSSQGYTSRNVVCFQAS